MNRKDAEEFADRIQATVELMNAVGFADMKIPAPSIRLYKDDEQYYDPNQKQIHLGIHGINNLFDPKDEEELFSAVNYIRGHEEQHCRSTASTPYDFAINQAIKTFVEYVQFREDGARKKFRRSVDYERYINELEKKGCYINWQAVRSFIAHLTNSLEDGRIERLRSNRFPGFAALRRYFRGKFWFATNPDYKPWDEIKDNPVEKLKAISAEILTLATCNLFTGEFDIYEGTPMETEVRAFMPDIAAAVMSGRTRGLIDPVNRIVERISPVLYDAFKLSEQDVAARQAFEQLMQDLMNSLIEKMLGGGNLSEGDEDTDDGSANSVFGHSDLVVTVSDEMYDKMTENTSQKESGNGQGIMIRREHPKEETTGKTEESDDASADRQPSGTEQGPDKDENASKQQASSQGASGQSDDVPENQNTDAKSDKPSDGAPSGEAKQDGKDQTKNSNQEKSDKEGTLKNRQEEKRVGKEAKKEALKEVLAEMQEAAASARIEAETNINSANRVNAAARKRATATKTSAQSKPVTAEEMKDICDFVEVRRQYKMTENLPVVYMQRGRTLHRKNEQYFKSLSTPNVTYQSSGGIDPSRIYGLAIGDTDVFRKKGKNKKFDGCAYILIDNSGSMCGEKRTEACKAAAVIEEGFRDILPFKIVAFDYGRTVVHEVVKDWNETQVKNCCWNFCKQGRSGGGNEDGYDVQIAERELMARPESKKLLLVLSDGTPGNPTYCKRAIENARKKGIKVHGIYFETGECRSNAQFADMYQKDYVCCPLSELDMNFQKIMKTFSRS